MVGSYLRSGGSEPYRYTVYGRTFGDFPARNTVYTPYIYMVLANPRNTSIHDTSQSPGTIVRHFLLAACMVCVCGQVERNEGNTSDHNKPHMTHCAAPLACILYGSHLRRSGVKVG